MNKSRNSLEMLPARMLCHFKCFWNIKIFSLKVISRSTISSGKFAFIILKLVKMVNFPVQSVIYDPVVALIL